MDERKFFEEVLEIRDSVNNLSDSSSEIRSLVQRRQDVFEDKGPHDNTKESNLDHNVRKLESISQTTSNVIEELQETVKTLDNEVNRVMELIQRKLHFGKSKTQAIPTLSPGEIWQGSSKVTKETTGSIQTVASDLGEKEVLVETSTKEQKSSGASLKICRFTDKGGEKREDSGGNVDKNGSSTNTNIPVVSVDDSELLQNVENKPQETCTLTGTHSAAEESTSTPHGTTTETQSLEGEISDTQLNDTGTKIIHINKPIARSEFGFKRKSTDDGDDNRLKYLQEPRKYCLGRKERISAVLVRQDQMNISVGQATAGTHCRDTVDRTQGDDSVSSKTDRISNGQRPLETFVRDSDSEMRSILSHYMEKIAQQASPMSQKVILQEEQSALLKWNDIAYRECRIVPFPRPPRGKGPDTVLCFDTSQSMSGQNLRQMIDVALEFVQSIEVTSHIFHIEENLSVVRFGGDSRVLLHLTNDYTKVKSAIESLNVCGSTPLAGGLLIAAGACSSNAVTVTIADIPVKPRIILFSDGKGTPLHWTGATDDYDQENYIALANAENSTAQIALRLNMEGHTVFCVAIGDANMRMLELISRLTQGKVFQTSHIHRLVKTSQNMTHAAGVVKESKNLKTVSEAEPVIRLLCGMDSGRPPKNEDMEDVFDLAMVMFKRQLNETVNDRQTKSDVDELSNILEGQHEDHSSPQSMQQFTLKVLEEDKKFAVALEKWHNDAESERLRGVLNRPRRGKGPDTVLCLDTSQSMQGKPFEDMISMALEIVEGIELASTTLNIQENIAIASFGRITKVAIHLTNDYQRVKQTIKSLKPGGLSPVFAGLLMSLAGCLGNENGLFKVDEAIIHPRVVFISDGKATPEHWKEGRDDEADSLEMMKKTLELISEQTFGLILKRTEVHRIVQMNQNMLKAVGMFPHLQSIAAENEKEAEQLITAVLQSRNDSNEDVLHLAINLFRKRNIKSGIDDTMMIECDSEMPPIGTRVRRGPDWSWPDFQDLHGPGTVTSHDTDGMMWVEWDLNGHRNSYHYKYGRYDVVIVDEERVLGHDEEIAVGCPVSRGKDWNSGDRDGGPNSVGIVCRVNGKKVHVRWSNKVIMECRFGHENCYDIKLLDRVKRRPKGDEKRTRAGGKSDYIMGKRDDQLYLTERGIDTERTETSLSVEEMNRRNARK